MAFNWGIYDPDMDLTISKGWGGDEILIEIGGGEFLLDKDEVHTLIAALSEFMSYEEGE